MERSDRTDKRKIITIKPIDPREEEDLDDFIFKDEEKIGASER